MRGFFPVKAATSTREIQTTAKLPLASVLRAVGEAPRTPAELAADLGTTPGALEGMLRTLQSGGYVQEAVQGEGHCACGPCALKSLCRNAEGEVMEHEKAPALHLLRLTPRGEAYLARLPA